MYNMKESKGEITKASKIFHGEFCVQRLFLLYWQITGQSVEIILQFLLKDTIKYFRQFFDKPLRSLTPRDSEK